MDDMPSTRDLRRRAQWAVVPAAAVLLLAGCGLDGSDAGVHALVPPSTLAGGQSRDPNAEMSSEQSLDATGAAPADTLLPSNMPQASLPPRDALPANLPHSVAVVGDSLTESAQQEITTYLKALGIDVVTIDGAKNRRMTDGHRPAPGIDSVERIKKVADPELWVIALGTNDVGAQVSPEQYGNDVTNLLDAIPADAPVVWVDVWIRDRQQQVETANSVLRDTLASRDNSIVADWFAHGDDPGMTAGDGIHLTPGGRAMFAATIAAATVDLFQSV
jgi:lysophospholipase L1-like esterase